tara:strand:- start:685 stop:1302 length:618 start_codon:yes stop_codon:yes gene_type:complete
MREPIIESLFPTPIYITNIDRDFTNDELQFVNTQKDFTENQGGNFYTKDSYILNNSEFKNIKTIIEKCCDDYLKKIICPNDDLKLYITQSWLNYTKEDKFHHSHNHPNSIVSGVLYIDCDKENDKIQFVHSKGYQQLRPDVTNWNKWNSETWWFPVEAGKLIMFPSSTTHEVEIKKGSNTRVSLAFNTFYKGKIGANKDLTELVL